MVPEKHINQASLWMNSVAMVLAKADWKACDTKYVAFVNENVPAYTAEELFEEVVVFKNGDAVRRTECFIKDDRAEAQYEFIQEGQVVPSKKKKAAKKKAVKKED